mmetsp:Transcript_62559/g.166092  ORF Transcript_62559/g.166092 Transcript_62559/m.166092 type:complete len:512 (-) Transcript_62559:3675-5210(-)
MSSPSVTRRSDVTICVPPGCTVRCSRLLKSTALRRMRLCGSKTGQIAAARSMHLRRSSPPKAPRVAAWLSCSHPLSAPQMRRVFGATHRAAASPCVLTSTPSPPSLLRSTLTAIVTPRRRRLMSASVIACLPNHDFVWMLDANNVSDVTLDSDASTASLSLTDSFTSTAPPVSNASVTMRYSHTPRPPRQWKFPTHQLKDPTYVDGFLRARASEALSRAVGGDSRREFADFLDACRLNVQQRVNDTSAAHHRRKARILGHMRAVRRMIGDVVQPAGSLDEIPDTEPTKAARIDHAQCRMAVLMDEWTEVCRAEQQRWCDDRGFENFVAGESCCRQFFQDKTDARTYSHIEYFGGEGGIFNLREPAHPLDRAVVLDALVADGRQLPDDASGSLSLQAVINAERVQQTIDELQTGTQTGEDGWTAEFFKVVGMRLKKDESGERPPSALASLLARVYHDCAQCTHGGCGDMLEIMKTSIVSLILPGSLTMRRKRSKSTISSLTTRGWCKTSSTT